MKKSIASAVAAVALLLQATSAYSSPGIAEVSAFQGKVLVNQGEGYVAVTGPMGLNAGDRILVGEEGSALISYLLADCKVSAAASSVVTISETAPCKAGEVVSAVDSVFVQAAADIDTDSPDVDADVSSGAELVPLVAIPIIGIGIVACAVWCFDDDDDDDEDGVSP